MDTTTRATLEIVYRILLSAVVEIARALGKPSPVVTRAERRMASYAQQRQGEKS